MKRLASKSKLKESKLSLLKLTLGICGISITLWTIYIMGYHSHNHDEDNQSSIVGKAGEVTQKSNPSLWEDAEYLMKYFKQPILNQITKNLPDLDPKPTQFQLTDVLTQTVVGRNFFMKIRISESNYVFVRIYQALPDENMILPPPKMTGIQCIKHSSDKLKYFQGSKWQYYYY